MAKMATVRTTGTIMSQRTIHLKVQNMNHRYALIGAVLLACGMLAFAGCDKQPEASPAPRSPAAGTDSDSATTGPATAPATQASAAENTKCPVSGDPIDPKDPSLGRIAYKGKTYAFCCMDCRAQFLKDPEKAIASLASAAKPSDSAPMNMDKK